MTRLLLVRHGLTQWNVGRRYQGHSDTALCPEGLAQAKLVWPDNRRRKRMSSASLYLARSTHSTGGEYRAAFDAHFLVLINVESAKARTACNAKVRLETMALCCHLSS